MCYTFYLFLLGCLSGVRTDDCEVLRQENSLLRELLAVQNSKEKATPTVTGATGTLSPTYSPTFATSTFTTLATIPISTELKITLYGQAITTTIIEYETKETVGTTLVPTSVLVYPSDGQTTQVVSSSPKIDPSPSKKVPEIETTRAPTFRSPQPPPKARPEVRRPPATRRPPASRRPAFGHSRQTSRQSPARKSSFGANRSSAPPARKASSFSLSSSKFPGFKSAGFRFKRETIAQDRETTQQESQAILHEEDNIEHHELEIELDSSMAW